jgi:hypothetical protein
MAQTAVQRLLKISAMAPTNLVNSLQQRCSGAIGARAATFQSMPQTWLVKYYLTLSSEKM